MPTASPRARACARWLVCWGAAVFTWAWPGLAGAEEDATSSLHWVRLPGSEVCVGSQELARAVEKRLGRPVFVSAARGQLAVEGHVEHGEEGYRARISVSRADGSVVGTRELGPEKSCRELDEGLVVVIALLLDPDASPVAHEPMAESSEAPPPQSVPSEDWDILAHGAFGVLIGPLPSPAPVFQVGIGVGHLPSWLLELSYVMSGPVDTSFEEATGRFRLQAAEVNACRYLAHQASLRMGACLGIQGGVVAGSGRELQHTTRARLPYMSAALKTRGALELTQGFWLELEGGLAAALVRPAFSFTALDADTLQLEQQELWRALPWALSATIRFIFAF